MSKPGYTKLQNEIGIYQNKKSLQYLAVTKSSGKNYQKTFKSLPQAKVWRKRNRKNMSTNVLEARTANLKEVWRSMQETHFPNLAPSTCAIWTRRYFLIHSLEHLPMSELTHAVITAWVNENVQYFKLNSERLGKGNSGRCNLNNELNLIVTIFNWYRQSEKYEKEAFALICPVKKKHKEQGFIKPLPDKRKQINLQDALLFFDELKPLYKDLALLQFYCAGRIGEIAGLQWSTVNLEQRRMIIKHTCNWDMTSKKFLSLKNFPKNREPRPAYITREIAEILERRAAYRLPGNDFVFHVDGRPLNY